MTMNDTLWNLLCLTLLPLGIWLWWLSEQNARNRLSAWASAQGYQIVQARRVWWGGPFWWKSRNGMTYWVEVNLPARYDTPPRHAWVFVGYPFSFFAGQFQVRWDGEPVQIGIRGGPF